MISSTLASSCSLSDFYNMLYPIARPGAVIACRHLQCLGCCSPQQKGDAPSKLLLQRSIGRQNIAFSSTTNGMHIRKQIKLCQHFIYFIVFALYSLENKVNSEAFS